MRKNLVVWFVITVLLCALSSAVTYSFLMHAYERQEVFKLWIKEENALIRYYRNTTCKYVWNETANTLVISGGSQKVPCSGDLWFALFVLGATNSYPQVTYVINYTIQIGNPYSSDYVIPFGDP